jgi:hypothetical protein
MVLNFKEGKFYEDKQKKLWYCTKVIWRTDSVYLRPEEYKSSTELKISRVNHMLEESTRNFFIEPNQVILETEDFSDLTINLSDV